MGLLKLGKIGALILAAAASNIVVMPSAHAIQLIAGDQPEYDLAIQWQRGSTEDRVFMVIECTALLPICLLDAKVGEKRALSRADLLANGYSPAEADRMLKKLLPEANPVAAQEPGATSGVGY